MADAVFTGCDGDECSTQFACAPAKLYDGRSRVNIWCGSGSSSVTLR
jgi:hypothetical protein